MKLRFSNNTAPTESIAQRGEGAVAIVLVGTAGVKRGIKALWKIVRGGYIRYVGAIVIIDFDSKALAYWEAHAPAVFRARAVTTQHASKPLGFKSDPPAVVLADRGLWYPEVEDALDDFALRQLACQEDGTDPGLVLIFGSGGGHAVVTVVVTETIAQRFPGAPIVVSYPIPDSIRQRSWARSTIEQLLALPIQQVVVQDDQVDPADQDEAWADLVTGLVGGIDANNLQDVAAINLFNHAVPAGALRAYLGVVETAHRPLPSKLAFHRDVLGPADDLFALRADVVQTQVLTLSRNLRNGLGLALRDQRVSDAALLRVVTAELDTESLRRAAGKVLRSLKVGGTQDWSTQLVFASLTGPYPPVPERPTVGLRVVDYYALADASVVLDQIFGAATAAPQPQPATQPELVVPVQRSEAPPVTASGHGNGPQPNGRQRTNPYHLSVRLNAAVR